MSIVAYVLDCEIKGAYQHVRQIIYTHFTPKFQDNATTGKQGLGIKDRPKKIAGVCFQGKKTSFSDSDDENSDDFGPPVKRMRDNAFETEKASETNLKLKKLCKQLFVRYLI